MKVHSTYGGGRFTRCGRAMNDKYPNGYVMPMPMASKGSEDIKHVTCIRCLEIMGRADLVWKQREARNVSS